MEAVLKKLGYKNGMSVLLENLPEDIKENIEMAITKSDLNVEKENYDFIMFFAKEMKVLDKERERLSKAIGKDGRLWIIYPKKSSKKYKSDLSRDVLWSVFGEFGFEPVSNFSVDEDWSALRFRKAEEIGKMKRKVFASEEGKNKGAMNAES